MMELEKKYPCRNGFLKNLYDLIWVNDECFPTAVFVYGHAGTGKTAIVKDFLRFGKKEIRFHGAYVNCIECYTINIFLESCVKQLICDNGEKQNVRCDNLKEFVESLRNVNASVTDAYVLALDNAERMRDMDGNVMPSLLRLQETTGLNICVLLISQIPFEKYHSKTGLTEVITLHCPQYSKTETLKILSTQFETAKKMLKSHITNDGINKQNIENNVALLRKIDIINSLTVEFFNNYLNIFLSVFYKACRDIPELRITACKCFVTYMEPVFNESVDIMDVSKLWRNIAAPLRVALSRVYMRFDTTENQVIRFSEDNNLPPKALLLVDNCSAHAPIDKLQSEDGNIIAYFLPPNVTAAVQPMDQNPIKLTKLIYRKKMLSQLIGDGGDIDKLLKRYSIRDAIILLKQAWDEVTQTVLKNSWSKLLNWDLGDYDSDDDLPLAQLAQQNEDCNEVLQLNLNLLNGFMPNNSVTVNEIEEWNEDVFTGGSNAENSDEEAQIAVTSILST